MRNAQAMKQTVIQSVIASSIFIIVAIVATPSMDEIVEDGRTLKVLRLFERISTACVRHHQDTGRTASEFSADHAHGRRSMKRYHQLSAEQLYKGWNGPYIMVPFSKADNPFGGTVELHNNLSTHPALGFDLKEGLAHEEGQYLMLTGIPEDAAKRLDSHLDGESSGSKWMTKGRVEYSAEDGGTLSLFILNVGE